MIALDTTVLVYAVGVQHPYRSPCQRLIEAIRNDEVQATTTVEVIQEFTHVRARRRDRADAAELARAYMELLEPLLIVAERDLTAGLRLFESHPGLGAFDAVLAATALDAGATALVSADAAYSGVAHLTHVVPDQDGVAKLLAG